MEEIMTQAGFDSTIARLIAKYMKSGKDPMKLFQVLTHRTEARIHAVRMSDLSTKVQRDVDEAWQNSSKANGELMELIFEC